MRITPTALEGVFVFDFDCFGDARGFFMESFSVRALEAYGLSADFVQDNHSYSRRRGTLRGLHFQMSPHAQCKLVRCSFGAVLDVAVDVRAGSPQYAKWTAVELSAENKRQLYIPKGFAHGFVTLSDDAQVQYKVDAYYDAAADRSILYSDPQIGVEWGCCDPILSQKDADAPLLKDSDCNYVYESGL